jgi:hypothetical protein
VPISSTNTPGSGRRASGLPRHPPGRSLRHSSGSIAPTLSFFSAEAHPFEEPPQGDFAKALAGEALQEATPLFDGGGGPGAYVLLEELPGGVVCYGGSSASFPGGKGLSLTSDSCVALDDRREADAEQAGGLRLGGTALLDCLKATFLPSGVGLPNRLS